MLIRKALWGLAVLSLCLLNAGCQNPQPQSPLVSTSPSTGEPISEVCCGGQGEGEASEVVSGLVSVDLGTIPQGPEITHTFELNNAGPEALSFTAPPQVNFPCCVTAVVSPNLIPPGGTATLTVTYKTRVRPGPFDLFIKLFPKDGDLPEQYHLSGQVERSFTFEPLGLDFSQSKTQEFQVGGDQLNSTFAISEVKSNSPHLIVRKTSETDKRQNYQVTWDGVPVEEKTPVIYIITDSELFTWAAILVRGVKTVTHPPEGQKS